MKTEASEQLTLKSIVNALSTLRLRILRKVTTSIVDWVNLRQAPDKSSESLAHLDAGTVVNVLAADCGEDKGWIRVLLWPEDPTDPDSIGMTGYIWHRYLAQ